MSMKKYLKDQISMKTDKLKVVEEKMLKAKTIEKDIDRNVTELSRAIKDAKNPKLGNELLEKSKKI